jgi:hypothetical protein
MLDKRIRSDSTKKERGKTTYKEKGAAIYDALNISLFASLFRWRSLRRISFTNNVDTISSLYGRPIE